MMENNEKRPPRRTLRAAAFHTEVAGFKHLLPLHYTDLALQIFPELKADWLRYAVAGRKEYWEGLPALKMVAGLEPLPKGFILKPVARSQKQAVKA